jgi:hypothetical protein
VNTEDFSCPNQPCAYFGITDAHAHTAFRRRQTWPCRADPDLSVSGLPHYLQCSTSHALVPAENPFPCRVAVVLTALAEGLDASAAERVFGYRQATITTWLSRAGQHAHSFHKHFFCHLQLPSVQLDELRTRLRCAKQVLWLWLAIDPCTRDSSCPPSRSPHAKCGPYRDPLSAADLGPRLPSGLHE